MAADNGFVRQNFVIALQAVAKLALQLDAAITQLDLVYQGAALVGTFTDAELANNNITKHLIGTDMATMKGQLVTLQGAYTANIRQSLAKCAGGQTVAP